ncbi:MAG: 30S ribosomal protein S17e [Candidatus Altiarchaeales archaeon]|nr:30S ribosomal protein S17e [Candidatus Altiarchaeota archaeon]MBU4341722.1 30S ribosomal protein S17e [Candidatus Altiarchaeota archaeon]MBU4406005.1 30S ribosomal protein S17e [Candidatus Altiarchaeota archaeon]MBU4437245.1 30S ribosomal protein S17e [Candidatus Altiarchaeota archaeon]MCG2783391.1 30S ribosomal protein S17e [Candidatus Altiarchaeales archaeon]
MGRIKQTYLKRIANELLEKYKVEFSKDFQKNKEKVQELSTVKSKSIRNKIAGYITKVMKRDATEVI